MFMLLFCINRSQLMTYFAHVPALSLPDLDALDPVALKAMILTQQDHFKAQHKRYTATSRREPARSNAWCCW